MDGIVRVGTTRPSVPYGYVFVYHILDPVLGNIVQYYRYRDEDLASTHIDKENLVNSTWILDIVRLTGDDMFTEFHSGLERNTAVNKRMIIGAELCMCMLSFVHARDELLERIRSIVRHERGTDLTHVDHTSKLFAYTLVNSGNKLLYRELKRTYTHMRASMIVYLRRLMVPDIARMIVLMAYP